MSCEAFVLAPDGRDPVRAGGGDFAGELPIEVEARGALRRPRLGERDPAHVLGAERGRRVVRGRQRSPFQGA